MYTGNPRTEEVEMGGPWGSLAGRSSLTAELQTCSEFEDTVHAGKAWCQAVTRHQHPGS